MEIYSTVTLLFAWLVVQEVHSELDYTNQGQGQQLQGDVSLAGFFPLHYTAEPNTEFPALVSCNEGQENPHGYHLMQAMRFTVEQINNSTGPQALLPGVKLGYQLYDTCSVAAGILASLDQLEEQFEGPSGPDGAAHLNYSRIKKVLAVIGPDSSSKSFVPAALLGAYLVPQISYEASNEMLSNKELYPSFLRTIPNDRNQVAAIIQILVHFNWTWIALLGSDNAYGLEGMQSISQQAALHGICIAYQGVIPTYREDTVQTMRHIVEALLQTKVTVVVVFSSKTILSKFLPFLIKRNITDRVWIGTEDWCMSRLISGIEGVHTIGTVLGVSVKYFSIPGFVEFERKTLEASMQHNFSETESSDNGCLQSKELYSLTRRNFSLEKYDITSSFNVQKAVYAVAHALHQALGCGAGECQRRTLHPWELLPWIRQVRFSLGNSSVYFDVNGDPPTGYDIVSWIWKGKDWSFNMVGSFTPDPVALTIDGDQIQWYGSGTERSREVPLSICSSPCPRGHRKLLTGQHTCCFDCLPCPAATFLNDSEPTLCQPCPPEQWAPPSSEQCLDRSVLLLPWDDPLAVALLFFLAACLLLTSGSAVILLLNLNTPVAKSAGGRTCLLMLAALTAAAMSSLCHFGPPSPLACVLKQPLFLLSFTVCLACVTVRSLQVVCIFKFASRLPPVYDKWAKNHGPEATILLASLLILFISVLRVAADAPRPSRDLQFYHDSVVLECSNMLSAGALVELVYVSLLSALCFSFSYMGKDLPANYNEAKSVTFSLMVYMISWMSFFTLYLVSRGPFAMAAHVFATLFSVLAFYVGYFLPKIYIIVMRPQMNTTAHFQNCIQMYTMSKQ
ncbi:taste receptor type 1 member 1 [Salarias fasciatus]|uniref:taste receptor type 1 member 1 n=1 Tax=Salarias fasciatus TaxID=181472 RepID=UPI001176CA40|nr:taste receptor type 1 member 2 [Salarias fasciatus]